MTVLRLRKTWPDVDHIFHVVDEEGEKIARISNDSDHVGNDCPPWSWGISVFGLPQTGNDRDREWTLEEAMAKVKALWPEYKARYSPEDYERERQRHHQVLERERRLNERHQRSLGLGHPRK